MSSEFQSVEQYMVGIEFSSGQLQRGRAILDAAIDSASKHGDEMDIAVRGQFPVRGFGHQMSAPLAVIFNSR
jgi:hypothetical protein